ncbi:MAG: hypothetical protein HYX55_05875 [Chloroflexi bacterium]|nr:hypothetical protein [Chloroflexota bacterium]
MSSARSRIQEPLGRVLRGAGWTSLLAVLAASGAGLVDGSWHAPGSLARAELTWAGDSRIGSRLDLATIELQRISDDVDQLATEAKTALSEVGSADPTRLRAALDRGGEIADAIDSATHDLREALIGLPGDGPNAAIDYSNATLVRRAAVLAAIDSASSLAAHWQQVTGRAADASQLTALIASHDTTVLEAAAKGVAGQFQDAIPILDQALLVVANVKTLRVRLIAGTEPTVLDEWIDRNSAYDAALKALYAALVASHGEVTLIVQSARREERAAFALLPPDRRTILVIVAEVARGGLTQAVLAIEQASGSIDDALAEAGPS